jgi:hypothetical protein
MIRRVSMIAHICFKTHHFLDGNGFQFPYKTKSKNKDAGTINRAAHELHLCDKQEENVAVHFAKM